MNFPSIQLPFGLTLSKLSTSTTSARPNRLLSMLLSPWSFGKSLFTERDYTKMLQAYRSWVYVCSSRNATGVAQSKLRLYVAKPTKQSKIKNYVTSEVTDKTRDYIRENSTVQSLDSVRKAADYEEILEHPILALMRNVNPFMNAFDLWEFTTLYQELTGNAYWLILSKNDFGVPDEVWPIPADKIRVVPDKDKFIKGYLYGNSFEDVKDNDLRFFKESEIIQFKYPSPRSFYYGMSPLAAVSASYNINEQMSNYELAVFQNMGRLEGAFETKESLSDDEFERLKAEIADAYFGVKNAGKSPLLENGVTYQQYGWNPRELSFTNGRKYTKEEIFNAFGIPMGLYDPAANRANADAAIYNWAKNSLRPRCMRMEQKLNEKLTPRYDPNIFLMFEDVVPEDLELAMRVRESNLKMGLTSRDEERKKLRMPELQNGIGAEPMMQVQYAPLSLLTSENHPMLASSKVDMEDDDSDDSKKTSAPKEEESKKDLTMSEDMIEDFVEEVLSRINTKRIR